MSSIKTSGIKITNINSSKKALFFLLAFTIFISFFSNLQSACTNPAFAEGVDRAYVNGNILSRGGVDYTVKEAGWANASGSDAWYAPGTGSNWTDAWTLSSNPCVGAGSAPTVTTTDAATVITSNSATSGGNVTADGGSAISARGIVYGIAVTPTLANTIVTVAGTTGAFVANLSSLTAGTLYYIRAYATNAVGTTYGPQVSFTTSAAVAPTVTTTAASGVSCSSFNSGGNVTSDGGASVTARGIVYGTSILPTLANTVVTTGSGTGVYSSAGSGLATSTTYYCRAYATNSVGTSYGAQISFTTSAAPCVPVLTTTDAASAITTTTATSGGTISSDGGSAVTARGVCYGIVSGPTISNFKTTDGAGTGAFVSALTGLTESITYYVRSYATNANGTGYGPEITFTAASIPKYYSCAGANTWSLATNCAVLSAAPTTTDHAIVRHDWYDVVNAPTYNLANLAHGQLDAGNWFAAKPLKLTVQNGGRVVFTTSSYTGLPATFQLVTNSGGTFASYTSFATIHSVVNNGALHFFGAVTNGNNITGTGQICYEGNFENSTLGGKINGQFISASEATLTTGFFTTTDATLGAGVKCGGMAALLPIELIDFTATKNGESVNVNWTTGSEINNDYFEVQASSDGKHWETISVVQGHGNTNNVTKYGIIDYDTKGYTIKYYRLKQVDFDGKVWYSIIRLVNFDGSNINGINVFDNGNNIEIQLFQNNVQQISIHDVNGKEVFSENLNNNNHGIIWVNKQQLASGVYFVTAFTNKEPITKKLFVR